MLKNCNLYKTNEGQSDMPLHKIVFNKELFKFKQAALK